MINFPFLKNHFNVYQAKQKIFLCCIIFILLNRLNRRLMQSNQNLFTTSNLQYYQHLYCYPYNINLFVPIYGQLPQNNFIPSITFIPTIVQIQPSVKNVEEKKGKSVDQGNEEGQKSTKTLETVIRRKIRRKQINEQPKIISSKKYSQNTKRNFFSNLARLVINFLNSEEKSSVYLSKIIPQVDPDLRKQFYKYIKKFKRNLDTYIKRSTLYNLLGLQQIQIKNTDAPYLSSTYLRLKKINTDKELRLRQLIRILAKYYLRQLLVPIILRSKRMSSQNRWQHLTLRRQLILAFESIRGPEGQLIRQ